MHYTHPQVEMEGQRYARLKETEKAEMTAKFPRRAIDVLNIPRVKDFGNVLVLHGHSVQSGRLGWRGRWFVRCAVVVCWRYPQSLGTSPTDYEGDLRIPEIRSLHSDNCKPRLELQVISRKRCSCSLIYKNKNMMYRMRQVANQDATAVGKREMGGICVPTQDKESGET